MPPTRIGINQFRLDPAVPLGRRGCTVESSQSHESKDGWANGYFAGAVERGDLNRVVELLRKQGEEVCVVIRRLCQDAALRRTDFRKEQQDSISGMLELRALYEGPDGLLNLECPKANWGALLECAVLISLFDLHIQASRDVKVQYPYQHARHDPDGQAYDVLAALDFSRLLWIECKKPFYEVGQNNPLGQVLNKGNVQKFYRRAHFLKPTIAMFLVDTKTSYQSDLRSLFNPDFCNSGCYAEPAAPANQLIARLHGFIYFARVAYRSNYDYLAGLRESISQVLHDARHDWVQLGYSGDPFL